MDSNSHYEGIHKVYPADHGFTIYPAALNIIWGKDGRYWKFPKEELDQAELVQVSWLEVTGWCDCDILKLNTTYEVEFELKLTPDAFGFNELPLYFMVKWGSKNKWKKIYLTKEAIDESTGTYCVPNNLTIDTAVSESKSKLCFGLYEVWSGKWKGGLIIKKVHIREKK
ncbi:protein PHLOEM PROTEIN 2-LIKE A9 [Capsicum galapagoense]